MQESHTVTSNHLACTGRVFVVHLRVDAEPGLGTVCGRVEHRRSGDAGHFESVEELVAFMAAHVDSASR